MTGIDTDKAEGRQFPLTSRRRASRSRADPRRRTKSERDSQGRQVARDTVVGRLSLRKDTQGGHMMDDPKKGQSKKG